jgi:hypothetical protein
MPAFFLKKKLQSAIVNYHRESAARIFTFCLIGCDRQPNTQGNEGHMKKRHRKTLISLTMLRDHSPKF